MSETNGTVSRQQLWEIVKQADDRPVIPVTVKDWGNARILTRRMSLVESAAYNARLEALKEAGVGVDRARELAEMVVEVCYAEDNSKLFTTTDVIWIMEKSAAACNAIFDAVTRELPGAPAAVDAAAKN